MVKNLPGSLEEENKKLVQISKAALILGVSIDTLRRWDKKGILKAVKSKGKRFYLLEELEKFGKEKTKSSTYANTYANEPEKTEKLDWQVFQWLSSAVESVKKAQVRLLSFNKIIRFSVLIPLVLFLVVIFLVSFLFLLKPRATTEFFNYKLKSQIVNEKGETAAVLAAQTSSEAISSQNIIANYLQGPANISVKILRTIGNEQATEIVLPSEELDQIRQRLGIVGEGDISPNGSLVLRDISQIKIGNEDLLTRLNTEFSKTPDQNTTIETRIGEIKSDSNRLSVNSLDGVSVFSLDLAGILADISADSVKSENIKDGEVKNSDLSQITDTNKVAGSAVQLSSTGGLINSSGLSLSISCSSNQILVWDGDSWECGTQTGGGGGSYLAGNDLDITGTTFDIEATLDSVSTVNFLGTGTINGLDLIDDTSESTIESSIDTLANLTSASSLVTVGTLTGGATGSGFTLNFGSSTLSGNITGTNISGIDISDDTNLSATSGISLTGDQLTATLGTTIANSEIDIDTINFDRLDSSLTLDEATTISSGSALGFSIGNNVTFAVTGTGQIIATDLSCSDCIGSTEISGLTWSEISSTPTTLSGYGITDGLSTSIIQTADGYFGDIYLKDDTSPSHYLQITNAQNLTAAHVLSISTSDADRTLTISANSTISGTNTGDQTITLTGDVTGSGTGSFAATIENDKILEVHLKAVDGATDEECLTYESTVGDFEWQSCGAGGSTTWDAIGDPTLGGAIAMAETTQTMDWNSNDVTALAVDGLTLTYTNDAATDILNQNLLTLANVNTSGSSTTEALLVIDNRDTNEAVTAGIRIISAAGGITKGVDFDDTDIVTDIEFQNDETMDNNTNGQLTFTGVGQTNNGTLTLDLETNSIPTLTSSTDTAIGIDEDLQFIGAQTISTSTGNLTIDSGANTILADATIQLSNAGFASCSTLATDSSGNLTCSGIGDTASFSDTTPAAIADNDTTELFNDATRPNITPNSTGSTILITVHDRFTGGGNTDTDAAVQIYRKVGGNPTCGTDTLVGDNFSAFLTNGTDINDATGTFLDSPATTSNVFYTVCSSSNSTLGSAPTNNRIDVTLIELGADLAENYFTSDESIVPGDIVSLDPRSPSWVKKSNKAYDSNAVGIVSTVPALTLSNAVGISGKNVVPVALAGRVPVKVSTENGRVKAGDFLTTSSIPGVAMKATKSGQIIGQALQDFGYQDQEIGLLVVFVKTGYTNGSRSLSTLPSGENSTQVNYELSEIVTDRLFADEQISTNSLKIGEGLNISSGGLVTGEVSFENLVRLLGEVEFLATPYFNSDTAGFATIRQGAKAVEVKFEKEYTNLPVVVASADRQILYSIVNATTRGFEIQIADSAQEDIKFNWIVLAVKNPKIFVSLNEAENIPAASPIPSVDSEKNDEATSSAQVLVN